MRGGNPRRMATYDVECNEAYQALRMAAAAGDLDAYYVLSQAARAFGGGLSARNKERMWMSMCKSNKARQGGA